MAGDGTDPLTPAGGYDERVTPLWASPGGAWEQVEIWGAGGRSDAFLRLSVRDATPATDALRRLLLALPEAQTGFRDLLIRDGYPLAASFTLPDICLTQLAPGAGGVDGLFRAHDLVRGLANLAGLLARIQTDGGLGWPEPQGAEIGLRRARPYAPPGHVQWTWQFTGWDKLAAGAATDAGSLARLLEAPLVWLLEQAAAGPQWCRWQIERVRAQAAALAQQPGLDPAGLQAGLLALLPQRFALQGATDVGMRRNHNEDAYLLLEVEQRSAFGSHLTLAAVADGMGGHASGEVASSLALDLLRTQLLQLAVPPRSRGVRADGLAGDLQASIVTAGRALLERAGLDASQSGMGTTLVGLARLAPQSTLGADETATAAPQCCVFNIGDSRAYLLGVHGAARLSADHSYVQELLDSGQVTADEAFVHPQKNVITRCLGGGGLGDPLPDIYVFDPGPGEIVLVCSDGLSDVLRDDDIARIAAEHPLAGTGSSDLPAYLAGLADALIRAANAAGGPDNITVVLAAAV